MLCAEIGKLAENIGARLILDISMAMRHAPLRGTYLMKPSIHELSVMLGCAVESVAETVAAARSLISDGRTEVVVVSLGSEGALLVTDTLAEHFEALEVPAKSAVGAGDSMVGAIVLALEQGWSLTDAVRYGVAAGTATIMTPGTELCYRSDVERLFAEMGELRVSDAAAAPEHDVGAVGVPLYAIKGVTKVYRSGEVTIEALRGVDATLYEGELAVMLGPSGSGKSTLLNILGGLDRATSGDVAFRGEELTRFSDRELTLYRRDHVGFVFQFYNLVPSLTARENVALVTEIARRPDEAGGRARPRRAQGPHLAFPRAAFRRRTAARGDCARDRQAARNPALRRADGRARFKDRRAGA